MQQNEERYDVVIVGAGNAALAAAVSAKENGALKVIVLEKAPLEMRGGNTHWSGGVLRFSFDDPRELEQLLPGVEKKYENFFICILSSFKWMLNVTINSTWILCWSRRC